MVDSTYPGQLDDDVLVPYVSDGLSDLTGDTFNGLRSAVFAIEECLGINPQGTTADVATRLDESLNPDGSIKASALSTVGLVTLPIVNSMIATNAGIAESKLNLNYVTVDLKTWIDSLWVFVYALSDHLNQDIYNLTQHVAHPSAYGRHRTSDIDGYVGVYSSKNLQGIVTSLYNTITLHIAKVTGAHAATAISFSDTNVDFDAVNVQTALEELNELHMASVIAHQDNQHSNGILKVQEAFYNDTNHSYAIVGPLATNTVIAGTSYIIFPSIPGALAQVSRDDRVDITVSSKTYHFYVESVVTASGIVNFWGTLPVSGAATATVYKTSEELSEPAVLALTIRQEVITDSLSGSIIQMIHPESPYILSSGLDLRLLSATVANVKFGWDGGTTASLNVFTAMGAYPAGGTPPSAWTVESLAIVLNEFFRSLSPAYKYPLVAFAYCGEIGIAFDEPSGYIQALACANSAWTALGFTGTEIAYCLGPRRFYLDGYEFSSVRLLLDANGDTVGINDIIDIDKNLITAGVKAPGIMRVVSSVPADSGTYSFNAALTDTLSSDGYNFSAGATVNVKIYGDSFGIDSILYRTLYELFIDGYANSSAELRGVERLTYVNGDAPAGNPESWFDIIDVSRTFAACERRININANVATFGERGAGKSVTNPGPAVTLPSPIVPNDAIGYRFRLYDGGGVDYIELEVASASYISAPEDSVNVDIYDRISEEHHVEIGVVLHNTSKFKHLSDRRLFGTVGRKDVKEDYTRDYVTYPISLLRGNGIIYGMDVLSSSIGTSIVSMNGGQVLVNGILYTIGSSAPQIPADNASMVYNLFVDDAGVLRLLEDDGLNSDLATPSTYEIINSYDKVIIGRITVDAGNLITAVTDLRRFVNNIDNKIELVVDDTGTYGYFASLFAASDYLLYNESAVTRIIRVNGTITHDISVKMLSLQEGTILEGDSSGQEDSLLGSRILLVNNALGANTTFIEAQDNCTIRNLTVTLTTGMSITNIMAKASVSNFIVEKCLFNNINTSESDVYFLSAGYISNFKLLDSTFIFSETASNCNVFKITGSATDSTGLEIDSCRFYFSVLTALNEVIVFPVAGTLSNSYITNCYVSFPVVTIGASQLIIGGMVSNCRITGNTITGASYAASNVGVYVLDMERTIISDCLFDKTGVGIVVGSILFAVSHTCNANTIKDNVFIDSDNTIYLYNPQNCKIDGNIVFNSIATANMIYLTRGTLVAPDVAPTHVIISNNILVSTNTAAPDGYMIHVGGTNNYDAIGGVKIKNNFLINNSDPVISRGVRNGIVFDGTLTTAPAIEDNFIIDFKGASSEAVLLNNCIQPKFVNNVVLSSRHPLHLYDCTFGIVSGNYLQTGGGGLVSVYNAEGPCLLMDGSAVAPVPGGSCLPQPSVMTITNNVFEMYNYVYHTTSNIMPSEVVKITNEVMAFGKISDNVFFVQADVVTVPYAVLSVAAKYFTITDNILYASGGPDYQFMGFDFPYLPMSFSSPAPFVITGDYAFVTDNNLDCCAMTAITTSKLTVTGTKSIDFMNKGGTYFVTVPITHAKESRDNLGVSTWLSLVGGFQGTNATYDAATNLITWAFGENFVPPGATIDTVKVNFTLTGAVADLQMGWFCDNGFPSAVVVVRAATNVSGTGAGITETITPTTPPIIMAHKNVHRISITATNTSPVWSVSLGELQITYRL